VILDQFRTSFLSTATFVRRAYACLKELPAEEYLARTSPGVKELLEEIAPLAGLLKHLDLPERDIRCRYAGGAAPYDGQIRLQGREVDLGVTMPHYYVEVTTAVSKVDHLKREGIRKGVPVFGGPDIQRVGSRAKGNAAVVSKATAQDGDASAIEMGALVLERILAKEAGLYPEPCILLINAVPEGRLEIRQWAEVARAARPRQSSRFAARYVVNWGTNTAFAI